MTCTSIDDKDTTEMVTIPEYFKGKTVFITGGSGFMGKVLIEKLLYSCSDLDRIYILMRSKKGVNPEERLQDLYKSPCFNRIRIEKPGAFEAKVCTICGDISEESLGISEDDRALLVNKINIIFHAAASVRFDDHFKDAVNLNLRGTKEIVELAKEVCNLEALIHVSTSYSNTNRNPIEECMYPALGDWREALKICENCDVHTLQVLTSKYLGEMPNTYVFTKQLAEQVVYEEKGKLPVAIIRPSIVISSHTDPSAGYIDNFNGPTGLMVACGKGVLRVLYSDPEVCSDYIPVDLSIKGMIAAAWIRGTTPLHPSNDIPIYNHCSGDLHSLTIKNMLSIGLQFADELPMTQMLWAPRVTVTKSSIEYTFLVLLLHILPAIFIDTIQRILQNKPILLKIQRRIYVANYLALGYFTTQQWKFSNTNYMKLRSKLKSEDHEHFYYPLDNIDTLDFYKHALSSGIKHLLKENVEDITQAQNHYRRMILLDRIVRFIFYTLLLWWILSLDITRIFFNSIISLATS